MRISRKIVFISLMLSFVVALQPAFAATSPGLKIANTFVILSSTYSNTVGGTTLTGDVGYTTPPAMAPTINGTVHQADTTYNQAGIDQGSALVALNNQACSFTFAPGAIDLASDATHGTVGVYTPGVYCITGAADIGGGGTITLTGTGTFIFRMDGALNSSANSVVQLAGGASACNVWWTPTAATTLGADSTFVGTDIDASGITIGSNVTWNGRALAYGGTVSTDTDTISTGTCNAAGYDSSGNPIIPGLPRTDVGSYTGLSLGSNILVLSLPTVILTASTIIYLIQRKRKSIL